MMREKKKTPEWVKWMILAAEIIAIVAVIWLIIEGLQVMGLAEDYRGDAWVICKPGDFVNVRSAPKKDAEVIGRFDCGDAFQTDWEAKNGFIHVFVSLEETEGWIFAGYVSAWEPEWREGETAEIVSDGRVACRRWCDGPRIDGRAGWVQPGTQVQIFYWTPEWAVTNRGYIKSEYLGDGAQ
jgi:hypothetical protein